MSAKSVFVYVIVTNWHRKICGQRVGTLPKHKAYSVLGQQACQWPYIPYIALYF